MRVLHVLAELGTGGAAVVHRLLCDRMIEMGVDVTVFSYCAGGAETIFGSFGHERLVYQHEMTLTELLCRRQFDVVHAVSSTADRGLARSLSMARSSAAVVLTFHENTIPEADVSFAGALVTVSGALKKRMQQHAQINTVTIHNGIDQDVFFLKAVDAPARPVVLWVGRPYSADKDFAGFTALAVQMTQDNVDLQIIAAADETCRVTLEDWLPNRARVLRNLRQNEIANVYRTVSASGGCMVSTSISEGLPMSIMEALACGCPVIAPAIGGIPEIMKGMDACVYERERGVSELRKKIMSLIENKSQRNDIIAHGLSVVSERFTARRMSEDYLALYNQLLEKPEKRNNSLPDKIARRFMGSTCTLKRKLSAGGAGHG